MELRKLFAGIPVVKSRIPDQQEITGITAHSEKIKKGDLFVCITGKNKDGHSFIQDALDLGAVGVVVEKVIRGDVPFVLVEDSRLTLARLLSNYYGNPEKTMTLIGVTGTKGKTTTSWILWKLFQEAGIKTGYIGTILTSTGEEIYKSAYTTPEPEGLYLALYKMKKAGCSHVIMEVSSLGIQQKRMGDLFFETGIFTNLGRDHIGKGEHESFEEYKSCKSRFLMQCKHVIVNRDDPWQETLLAGRTDCVYYYGKENAHFQIKEWKFVWKEKGPGTSVTLLEGENQVQLELSLPGMYNIYNAVAATETARQYGISWACIKKVLKEVAVPGRMEAVFLQKEGGIFVDYAHNAYGLKALLTMMNGYKKGKILLLFGCGGNRSKDRRKEMGRIAGELSDYTILTTDNPRMEDPQKILSEIQEGLQETGGKYKIIPDRKEAIFYGMALRGEQDILLVVGKGHETDQEIQGIRYPLDDREIIKEKTCTQTSS